MSKVSMNEIPANAVATNQTRPTSTSPSQIWNIFRKDLRHHWREIAASIALLAGFVWIEAREWSRRDMIAVGIDSFVQEMFSQLIVPLVPISWIFLIVRAVQGESLVGDRQFWVTRPYEWTRLAATKIFFVIIFINLPLLLADILLLALAGFPPFHYIGGLLWMQAAWIAILLLPTAALAAVTASIGQMLLSMLVVALFGIGMAALAAVVPNSEFAGSVSHLYFVLMLLTASAVLLMQYSRRTTAQSRWLIGSLGAAIALIMILTPYRMLIAHAFPLASGTELPLQLSLIPSHAPTPDQAISWRNIVPIDFDLSLSGLPPDSFVEVQGDTLTLTNAQGGQWDSHWQGGGPLPFPDHKSFRVSFYMKRDDFDRMKSSPVSAKLLLAFTLYRDKNQRPFVVPPGEFAFENFGLCTANPVHDGRMECRAALHGPAWLLVTAAASASTCPALPGEVSPNRGGIGHQFLRNSSPADLGISPVRDFQISLSDWSNAYVGDAYNGICPGTPLTLSTPEEISSRRLELRFDNLSLADYQECKVKPDHP
jgi:hypothetical protein